MSNPPAYKPSNGTRLTQGYIAIQAESHPYRFRKIELLDLEGCMDPKSPAYRSFFVKSRPSACTVPSGTAAGQGLPEGLSLERTAAGYAFRCERAGILEVTTLAGSVLRREALAGASRVEIPLRRSGLVLVRWRSGREIRTFPALGL